MNFLTSKFCYTSKFSNTQPELVDNLRERSGGSVFFKDQEVLITLK